ncbi:MAG: nickel-responsive transcriptional regulator NikR [Candidatus Omnitrophica bacterium]|nr:nickel-responsive transcriptional regulator NikR [Candidatus Omnitrophota bacterium]
MSEISRFGISLPADLVGKFDKLIGKKGYTTRSKAIGDLIRQELIKVEWTEGGEIAGVVTMIYDHHKNDLLNKTTVIQHDFQDVIISTQHIHLDHHNCLEIIAVKGSPDKAQELLDGLRSLKGVKHATLSMSSTGKEVG